MELQKLKNILEALLLSADKPMDLRRLESLFEVDEDRPSKDELHKALAALQEDYQDRGIELKEVASGYRMQVAEPNAPWVARMWEEKPPKYSRALLETLVLIAYRQPITRGEIEDIRGVSVSTHIIKTLLEREWVRVLGHKDVPGKPAMYGTTREFLDYFNLKSLDELPPLSEIKDLDKLHPELALDETADDSVPEAEGAAAADSDSEADQENAAQVAETEAQADVEELDVEASDVDAASAEDAQGEMAAVDDDNTVAAEAEATDASTDQPRDATAEATSETPNESGDDVVEARPDGVSEDGAGDEREAQIG